MSKGYLENRTQISVSIVRECGMGYGMTERNVEVRVGGGGDNGGGD